MSKEELENWSVRNMWSSEDSPYAHRAANPHAGNA